MDRSNIILIGMPGSGKSTVGPVLAGKLGFGFIDTDAVIRTRENKDLKDIVNECGLKKFLEIQEAVLMELNLQKHVISTGGSIVYNARAVEHLKKTGLMVYLKLPFEEIEKRLAPERRFARDAGQSFRDLYEERTPLYEKYADFIVDCSGKSASAIADEIVSRTQRGF